MKLLFDPKLLKQFSLGTVVGIRGFKVNGTVGDYEHVGHVTGFSTNCFNEVTIKVRVVKVDTTLSYDKEYHPSKIDVFNTMVH